MSLITQTETHLRTLAHDAVQRLSKVALDVDTQFHVAERVVDTLRQRLTAEVLADIKKVEQIVLHEVHTVLLLANHEVNTLVTFSADEPESAAIANPVQFSVSAEDDALIDEMFKYHAPEPGQLAAYQAVNDNAKMLARVIMAYAPKSADRSHAIRVVRDARMWANAAIALKGKV